MLWKIVVGLTVGLVVVALGSRADEPPIAYIKAAEVYRLLQEGRRVLLIDVRSYEEYVARHIKGAISIPLNTIGTRYAEIPREGPVVLY